MRLLAELVGSGGQVTGLDSDGQLGREGLGVLQATLPGPERFAFVEIDVEAADVTAAQAFPGYPFDVVYARLLLHHLREPVAMLRKLAAWARPGGLVVARSASPPSSAGCTQACTGACCRARYGWG